MNAGFIPRSRSGHRLIAATVLMSLPLAAASLHAGNWDVDGLNGTLQASGMLVSAPCVLMPESQMQEISLGAASLMSLKQPGDVTLPVDVHIVLDDCPGGVNQADDRQNIRGGLWLSDQSVVRMTVTGEPAADDARFFNIRGASGVSLRMASPDGALLVPGMASQPLPLSQGRNDLVLKAQLWRNSQPVQAGEWQAVVHIGMEYE